MVWHVLEGWLQRAEGGGRRGKAGSHYQSPSRSLKASICFTDFYVRDTHTTLVGGSLMYFMKIRRACRPERGGKG